eukprot:scaffold6610_cov163-Amphora_coffeaeformis.AAC.5
MTNETAMPHENPLTVHDVGGEVDTETVIFRAVWSLIAERLVVPSKLSRCTKEEIATAISDANECPVCVTAHALFGSFADHVKMDSSAAHDSKTTEMQDNTTLSRQRQPTPIVSTKQLYAIVIARFQWFY